MPGLDAAQVLNLAEAGHQRSWAVRGLLLLASTWTDSTHEQRAALPCGERDRALIGLRIATFGPTASLYAACSGCGEQMEAQFDLTSLKETPRATGECQVEAEGREYTVRPPCSADFLALDGIETDRADEELIRLTVSAVDHGPLEMSDVLRKRVSEAIVASDPLSSIELGFACRDCGRNWNETLDIVHLLWKEIETAAQRVAWQVHTLARAYGWTEQTILKLSPERRTLYIKMVAND
jgi:hypothetical protein